MSLSQSRPPCTSGGTWALCRCKVCVKKQVMMACTKWTALSKIKLHICQLLTQHLCQQLPPHLMGPGALCAPVQVEAVQLTKPSSSSLLRGSWFDSCQMFLALWLLLLLGWYWWECCLNCSCIYFLFGQANKVFPWQLKIGKVFENVWYFLTP